MLKKIFIFSSVIFGVLLIFWGVYNFAFKTKTEEPSVPEKKTEKKPVVPVKLEENLAEGKIKDVSGEGVIAPVFQEESNDLVFYAALDGRVFSINPDGSGKKTVSTQVLPGLSGVAWSPDQKKTLSEFEGGARRYSYDYQTKNNTQLSGGVKNPVWSNLGDKIFYQFYNGKANELSMADPDGSNWKKITNLTFEKIKIAPIPQTSLVTFWNYPKAAEETALSRVGMVGGEIKKIFGGKFGADYLWSPNGKKALISFADSANGAKMSLGILDADGSNFSDLGIPTFVSKCAWSADGKIIFYALPGNISPGAVLPDEYQERKLKTQDTFWSVNLETNEKTRLLELDELSKLGVGFDAENLFLAPDEKMLFFTNRTDGHLYRLDLPKRTKTESQD